MTLKSIAGTTLLLAGLVAATSAHCQSGRDTSNIPLRSGEASTMTNGVPNLSASNPQPGELGIQIRLVVRKSVNARLDPDTSTMGAARSGPQPAGASPTAVSGAVR